MDTRLCWWCCHPWEGEELNLPFKIEPKTKNYLTMGQFCSWSCMKSFNMDRNGTHKGSIVNEYITALHNKMTDKFKIIQRAPDRYALKSFGGDLTIEEFRNANKNEKITVSYPNQAKITQVVIKETKISFQKPSEDELEDKMRDINNTNVKNETLKLRRSKPLKREQNNLETMMGLTRTKKAM